MASSADGTGGEAAASAEKDPCCSASPTAEVGKLCRGRCKWFDVSKGYGFITPDDNTGDVFVYQAMIHMDGFRSLDDNEPVEFVFKISELGREAESVTGPGGGDCKGSKRKGKGKKKKDDRCYNCNEHGHHAKNCPEHPLPKRCHHCKSEDHLVAECPDKPAPSTQGSGAKSADNGAASGDGTGKPPTSSSSSAAAAAAAAASEAAAAAPAAPAAPAAVSAPDSGGTS